MSSTTGLSSAKEKAVRLFLFVRDGIRYNVYAQRPTDSHFKASRVLAAGEGYCVQKAVLLTALARCAGIPARLRFAEIRAHLTPPELVLKRGSNVFAYHGLADLYIILHEALLSQYKSPCFSPQHQLQERLRSENYRQAAHGSSFQEC